VDQLLFVVVAILSYLSPPVLLPWAWIRWTGQQQRFAEPRWRSIAGLACLLLASLQAFAVIVAFSYFFHGGNFNGGIDGWYAFICIARWLAPLTLLVCLVGKGRGRVLATICSVGLVLASFVTWELR